MKKVLFSVAALLAVVTAQAQEVRFGAKAGLNLAKFSISTKGSTVSANTGFRPSFYVGGLAEIGVAENFFVEAGLQYVNNGGTSSTEARGVKNENSLSLHQLNIPVSAKYAVAEGFMLKGGLYLGYLMSGSVTTKVSNSGRSSENTEDIKFEKDGYNHMDFGLSVGAEYNLPQGIFFEAGYNFGLGNLANSDNIEAHNRGIQLGVGYKF